MSAPHLAAEGQPPTINTQQTIYHIPPPDDPPPSYADATHSSSSPLLVGPPPNYGSYRAYPEPDQSSISSSDIESTSRSLPEWVGQALVVLSFLFILYCFWKLVNDTSDFPG